MLYESAHLRVETGDGIATLWLAFPGSPMNALDPARLAELGAAIHAVERCPGLEVLVIRSALPGGFCGGYTPDALTHLSDDPTGFSRAGQRAFDRLAAVPLDTVAFIEGPCLGPGLELALACDRRLAVAGPDSWVGFPLAQHGLPPAWGGTARLPRRANPLLSGRLLTAREAVRAGVFDDACSARRGRIELHAFVDNLLSSPRASGGVQPRRPNEQLARERMTFRRAVASITLPKVHPVPSFEPVPTAVGFVGGGWKVAAVELALRGGRAVLTGGSHPTQGLDRLFADAVRWGRATPLEADQARNRVEFADGPVGLTGVEWVVAAQPPGFPVRPGRLILAAPATPEPAAGGWRERIGAAAPPVAVPATRRAAA